MARLLAPGLVEEPDLLKTDTAVVEKMVDKDPRMGYSIQMRFSEICFK